MKGIYTLWGMGNQNRDERGERKAKPGFPDGLGVALGVKLGFSGELGIVSGMRESLPSSRAGQVPPPHGHGDGETDP